MPKRVAEGGEGSEDGNRVYCFIRDLIVEGKDAKLVNGKGRFVINWSRALERYADYKSKKNPQFKCKKYNRRTASNGLRSALLNFYKKEGAKEYKESKQVNEKDEVVERQFQMPPRVFASLFGEVQLTEKSEEDRQETTSTASEGEMDAQVSPNSSSSDTGFDELMDRSVYGVDFEAPEAGSCNIPGDIPTGPCLNVKTEEDSEGGDVLPTDTSFPFQMFDDASALDSALEEICSDGPSDEISEDMDLLGVVHDICPTSGSVKGGYQFNISLTEQLPDDVTSGIANFGGVASVKVHKLNPFTLFGTVPASHQPGDVPVTVVTQIGQCLGMTCFQYVDEVREILQQVVKDPALQSLWFTIRSQEHGLFGNDSNIAQVLGPLNVQDQDSSSQTKQQQSLKVLQLLVYTAAQTDAQQFIEMIFSTSAGQVVFNSYKDRTPLPEDVARANGHEDLAQFLQDINSRLSKEISIDVTSCTIDWIELVKAAQNQASVAQDKSNQQLKHLCDSDDNSSEYFADAETSSCGSFDLDDVYDTDSDSQESTEKGLNKAAKLEDNFPMPQSASLDKKDKTESSILRSSPDTAYISDEADVQCRASEISAAKPKGAGNYSESDCSALGGQCDTGVRFHKAALNRPILSRTIAIPEGLMGELLRNPLSITDFEAGKMSSIEPYTADGISNQGPFTCKEVPSNSVPVEMVEPVDSCVDDSVTPQVASWQILEMEFLKDAESCQQLEREYLKDEPRTTNGVSEQGPIKWRVTGEEGCSNKITVEQEEPPNNTSDNHESCDWFSFSLRPRILSGCFRREDTSAVHAVHDTSDKRTTEPKEHTRHSNVNSCTEWPWLTLLCVVVIGLLVLVVVLVVVVDGNCSSRSASPTNSWPTCDRGTKRYPSVAKLRLAPNLIQALKVDEGRLGNTGHLNICRVFALCDDKWPVVVSHNLWLSVVVWNHANRQTEVQSRNEAGFVSTVLINLRFYDMAELAQLPTASIVGELFERISCESMNDFSGHHVYKNDSMFGSLGNDPGSVYKCSDYDADSEKGYLIEIEFVKLSATHVMVKTYNITAGNCSMRFTSNNVEWHDDTKETQLDVIEGVNTSISVMLCECSSLDDCGFFENCIERIQPKIQVDNVLPSKINSCEKQEDISVGMLLLISSSFCFTICVLLVTRIYYKKDKKQKTKNKTSLSHSFSKDPLVECGCIEDQPVERISIEDLPVDRVESWQQCSLDCEDIASQPSSFVPVP